MISYARQHIDGEDIAAVEAVLRSDWLTTGPDIASFEGAVAGYCGARRAVAVSSATAGLHAACNALGVGPGDRVWTSPNSFVATANSALYCGAAIDFVDIDPRTYNLSTTELERKLANAANADTLPKALIAVHFGGQPCDLEGLAALTRRYGIALLEDASHALGATYFGKPIGSCVHADAVIFSFQATKSIATGEGGMVVTNRDEIADKIERFRGHGITRDQHEMLGADDAEPWRYEQLELGFNYRMTDFQAALGKSQLKKLDSFVARRTVLAARYDAALRDLPIQLPFRSTKSSSAWHLYPIQLLSAERSRLRGELYASLLRNGIRAQVHFIPIHTQPFYRKRGFRVGDFPAAEQYYEGALTLPLYVDLAEADQDRAIEVVRSAFDGR